MLEFLFLHPYPRLSCLSGIPPRTGCSLSMGQPVPQPGSIPWVQALPERWNQPGTPCHSCAIVLSQCFESNFPDNTISPQEQGSCAFLGSPGPCVLWLPWMCKTYDKAPSLLVVLPVRGLYPHPCASSSYGGQHGSRKLFLI